MHYKRQTAVLSVMFVLVGMMFLVPAITGKAMAGTIVVRADGKCGTTPCHLTFIRDRLYKGSIVGTPTRDGTVVYWTLRSPAGGYVEYIAQGGGKVVLSHFTFSADIIGANSCTISILPPVPGLYKTCDKGSGLNTEMFYYFILPSTASGSGGSNSGSDSGDDNGEDSGGDNGDNGNGN